MSGRFLSNIGKAIRKLTILQIFMCHTPTFWRGGGWYISGMDGTRNGTGAGIGWRSGTGGVKLKVVAGSVVREVVCQLTVIFWVRCSELRSQ